MAAQVVQEGIIPGQGEDLAQLVAQQPHVRRGNGVPCGGHGGHVVEHVALGLFHRAEIGRHLRRFHHHLPQQQGAGADDLHRHAHDAHQGVDLGQIAAAGAQLLPYVRYGVEPDDVHPLIAQVEHVVHHVRQHGGVGIVQIPLVGIEGGHDDLSGFLAPGEAPRRGGGKDLGHGFVEFVGDVPAVVEEIAGLAFRVARPGAHGPGVILAGVVHHEVQAEDDPPGMAVLRQGGQIGHGAQLRLDLAEVRHGVAAVAAALGALQQRHQVQVVHAAVLYVVQLLPHAVQRAREGLHVHQHAHQLVPAGLPAAVGETQGFGPHVIGPAEHLHKAGIGVHIAAVQLAKQPPELLLVPRITKVEFLFAVVLCHAASPHSFFTLFIIINGEKKARLLLKIYNNLQGNMQKPVYYRKEEAFRRRL